MSEAINTITARRKDLYIRPGVDGKFSVEVLNDDGTAGSVAGYTPVFTIYERDGTAKLTLAEGSGITAVAANKWEVAWNANQVNFKGDYSCIFRVAEKTQWLFGRAYLTDNHDGASTSDIVVSVGNNVNLAITVIGGSNDGGDGTDTKKVLTTSLDTTEKFLADALDNTGNVQFTKVDTAGNITIKGNVDLSGKVDKVTGKSLILDTLITKLENIQDNYRGYYLTEAALNTAHPAPDAGSWANVEATDTVWVWDNDTLTWVNTDSNSMGDMLKATYDPQNIAGDAFARAKHTGEQGIGTITGLQAGLDGKEVKTGFVALSSVAGIQVPLGKKQLYYNHEITAAGTQAFSFDATATYEQAWVASHFVITNSYTADETRTFPSGWYVRSSVETADGSYATGTLTIVAGKTVEVNIINTGSKKIVRIDSIGDVIV